MQAKRQRRLILCLDGTWNREDSSTNVLQHYALVRECRDEAQTRPAADGSGDEEVLVTQIRYYQRGVGTGVLDGVTGGAFGLGLEQNVRDAYNWLLSNYQDGKAWTEPDAIYIFGFSRGAYTARSLVGFIATCGLLRRGAPLTVEELWDLYGTLGRQKEQRGSSISNLIGLAQSPTRRITELMSDAQPGIALPGVVLNATEALLLRWTRRVPISYLGVYDTVGAIGIDALAIPGLRGKLAMHNNVRPTSLIQRCRHALAVDEHRGPFNHTPFMAYVGDEEEENRLIKQNRSMAAAPAVEGGPPAVNALEQRAHRRWGQRIEQRWFAGAHSNVGGGYPSNPMAQLPLLWVQAGAPELLNESTGLAAYTPAQIRALPPPRNSFAEFAAPWSEHLLRAKPNYRLLRPYPSSEPELRAHPQRECQKQERGFALVSINEVLDESLDYYWPEQKEDTDADAATQKWQRGKSPHLHLAQQRRAEATGRQSPAGAAPLHHWLGAGLMAHFTALLWGTLAGLGWIGQENLFRTWPEHYQVNRIGLIVAGLAALFVAVDYAESRLNFAVAGGARGPFKQALRDVMYWLRAVGVAFALTGAASVLGWLVVRSWNIGCKGMVDCLTATDVQSGLLVAVAALSGACAVLLLIALANPRRAASASASLKALAAVLLGLPLGGALLFWVVGQLRTTTGLATLPEAFPILPTSTAENLGGQLLFTMGTLGLVMNSYAWVSAPLARANLGNMRALQACFTPAAFKAQLDFWSRALGPKEAKPAEQEAALLGMLRIALWRDALGFMPVYFICFAMGLRFARTELGFLPQLSAVCPQYWLLLPAAVVALDLLENGLWGLHLRARAADPAHSDSWALHAPLVLVTLVKTLGYFLCLLLVLVAVGIGAFGLCAFGSCAASHSTGWRQGAALLIALGTLAVTAYGLWLRFSNSKDLEGGAAAAKVAEH